MIDFEGPNDYVIAADNADVLPKLPDASFQLIYIDPPFNTGKIQKRRTLETIRSTSGDRIGFGGRQYSTVEIGRLAYLDSFDNYLDFLAPRFEEARRLLSADGTLYFHIDYREAAYCKVLLDHVFGRTCFLNEIIWAYDYGGRGKDRWPAKHDTILVYVKSMKDHHFDQDQIERIPYMAPGLVTAEKRERGKLPTDVWWHTIVPTNGREKTGYPNQKPEGILQRVLAPSSTPGSWILDFFGGSGTTGTVARRMGRRFVMVDANPDAITVMRRRLGLMNTSYIDASGAPLVMADLETESSSLF